MDAVVCLARHLERAIHAKRLAALDSDGRLQMTWSEPEFQHASAEKWQGGFCPIPPFTKGNNPGNKVVSPGKLMIKKLVDQAEKVNFQVRFLYKKLYLSGNAGDYFDIGF